MIECPNCGEQTPEKPNFCQHCRHKVRDLRSVKWGKGTFTSLAVNEFWETGDPSVFASPGAPDYRG